MTKLDFESFYFKEKELKLLLSGLGVTSWYGLFSENEEDVQDNNYMNQLIADLYQRNVITGDGDRIAVLQPFSKIFETMVKSKRCVTIRRSLEDYPIRCCYITAMNVVIMEKSQRDVQTVRLKQMPIKDWLDFVIEEVNEEDLEMCLRLRSCAEGICYEEVIFQEDGIRDYLILENESSTMKVEYQEEVLVEKLNEWIQGG